MNEAKESRTSSKYPVSSPQTATKKSTSEELLEKMKTYEAVASMARGNPRLKRSNVASSKKMQDNKKMKDNKHNKRSVEKVHNKRATRNSKDTNTVKFYSTVDELNEDTLKHSNISGTLPAKRMELKTQQDTFRRSNIEDNNNESLHIDFNVPKINNHITDNKIELADHENKLNLSHEKLNTILSNHSNQNKDKELSKLVVNELKPGSEVIGNTKAPVTSNITFTSENDTLTAMAYIAGNLLNKLWSMEKDSSGSTIETDDLKQEKITDLLDLFKEPLNLRQETFLKNVLESLSNVMDKEKDIKNGTLCQTLEEASKLIDNYNNSDEKEPDVVEKKIETYAINKDITNSTQPVAVAKAISKIEKVLGLMRKFNYVQQNLSNFKHDFSSKSSNNSSQPINKKLILDTLFTKDETNSLNTFGDLINKITKLLLPKKGNKKITNAIKDKNMLSDNKAFKNNVMKMFNIDLTNQTVNVKDKLILDYLTHIKSNPNCLLNKNNLNTDTKSLPTIEGNILLNLSEFFKMKSFADLITMLEPAKTLPPNVTFRDPITTTSIPVQPTTVVTEKQQMNILRDGSNKFATTKEKLKTHLKSIIEDLIELQDAKGVHPKGNIRIADALPCIYNIMNGGVELFTKNDDKKSGDIVDLFKQLKNEMKLAKTRRSDAIMPVRPKSAVVLERVIKNLAGKSKKNEQKTRRFLNNKNYKPLDEVKASIYKIRNISSTYKNRALYTDVPAAERLVLLKALELEVKNYVTALEGIKQASKNLKKLPAEQYADLEQFVFNILSNISLNEQVVNKYVKTKGRKQLMDTDKHVLKSIAPIYEKPLVLNDNKLNNNDMKISRNQIINHIIRKRVQMYLKLKEVREFNVDNDLNYNVAKRVLYYLDNGNYELAYELFKVLGMQKEEHIDMSPNISQSIVPAPKSVDDQIHSNAMLRPQLLNQFAQPKVLDNQMKWMSQDHLIKQLLNIKNMGI